MTPSDATVVVVDDDEAVCRSLRRLLTSVGWQVLTFGSAEEFLRAPRPPIPSCLVLDIDLPGQTGLEMQTALAEGSADIPVVFITGHGDIPVAVQAMRAGAVTLLPKPFGDGELLTAIEEGLALSVERSRHASEIREIRQRIAALTPRQREVMHLVVQGMMNKQIARLLNIAEKTVKVHRGQAMETMQVSSLAELVRAVAKADPDWRPLQ